MLRSQRPMYLEGNALRALFRTYLDLADLDRIKVKIFLRDDIWSRITREGFSEASHITKATRITWSEQAILNLIVRRALYSKDVRGYFETTEAVTLASIDNQQGLFYKMFPRQVDSGPNKPMTLGWILSRVADGTSQTAPREVIHLLKAAREEQLKLLEIGTEPPPEHCLSTEHL